MPVTCQALLCAVSRTVALVPWTLFCLGGWRKTDDRRAEVFPGVTPAGDKVWRGARAALLAKDSFSTELIVQLSSGKEPVL